MPSSPKLRKSSILKSGLSLDHQNKWKQECKKITLLREKEHLDEYEPTNAGMTFDHEYHGWKRAKSYWKYCSNDEENLTLKEVLKDL